jgi:hypothetical protein
MAGDTNSPIGWPAYVRYALSLTGKTNKVIRLVAENEDSLLR